MVHVRGSVTYFVEDVALDRIRRELDGLFCLLGYRQNVAKYHMNVRLYFDQPAFIYQVFAKIVVTSEKALHSSHCTTFCFFMGYSLFPICNVKYSDFSTFFRLMINIPEFLAMIRYSIFLFYPRQSNFNRVMY